MNTNLENANSARKTVVEKLILGETTELFMESGMHNALERSISVLFLDRLMQKIQHNAFRRLALVSDSGRGKCLHIFERYMA
jgi:hypothetical protein